MDNYLSVCINAFEELGLWLAKELNEYKPGVPSIREYEEFFQIISSQHTMNNWHTEEDLIVQLKHLENLLRKNNLDRWTSRYPALSAGRCEKDTVLVNLNPNFSFSGIHEWLCCYITRSPFIIKADQTQFQLLKYLNAKLLQINPGLPNLLITDGKIKPARYIVYSEKKNDALKSYFASKKAILIQPQPSIAILTGNETKEDLHQLGNDIFINLGQTSRTLRKIFVPMDFDIKTILDAIEPFSHIYRNNKYANNYDYHQSVFLMEQIPFLDNGFLVLKEDNSNNAPTGCLFYERYGNFNELIIRIFEDKNIENIMCSKDLIQKTVKPGKSHFFDLWDYPGKQDIVDFLLK